MEISSVRRSSFSLRSRAIGPLDFDGARRENVLRGAGYAWTPDLWSFLKLQEVGFSPYLGFIPILNVLLMFRLNEAVRGRWIGPKTWDRIIGNIFFAMEQPVTMGMGCLGVGCVDCVLNGCLVCIGPGMAVDCGFTR